MSRRYYPLVVIGCVFSWFMMGLHLPLLHQIVHHGHAPSWMVLAINSLFGIAGIAGLWLLLRARFS